MEVGLGEELSEHEDVRVSEDLLDQGLESLGTLAFGKSEELFDLGRGLQSG